MATKEKRKELILKHIDDALVNMIELDGVEGNSILMLKNIKREIHLFL